MSIQLVLVVRLVIRHLTIYNLACAPPLHILTFLSFERDDQPYDRLIIYHITFLSPDSTALSSRHF